VPAFCCPASQAGLDLGAAGFELRLLLEGEANEINQVGGDLRPAAANVGRVDTLVGAPELVRCQMRTSVNRLFNQRGERLDLLEREANGVGLAIENLQYLDLVFVVAEELFKRLHHAQGAFAHHFRWAGFQEMVLVDGINDLLVTLLYTKDEVAQGGVGGQRLGGLVQKLHTRLGNLLVYRLGLLSYALPDVVVLA
jgi:hypothetical protein